GPALRSTGIEGRRGKPFPSAIAACTGASGRTGARATADPFAAAPGGVEPQSPTLGNRALRLQLAAALPSWFLDGGSRSGGMPPAARAAAGDPQNGAAGRQAVARGDAGCRRL